MNKKTLFNIVFILVAVASVFGYTGQIEVVDPAMGGIAGIISTLALALGNTTKMLDSKE